MGIHLYPGVSMHHDNLHIFIHGVSHALNGTMVSSPQDSRICPSVSWILVLHLQRQFTSSGYCTRICVSTGGGFDLAVWLLKSE